MKQVYSLKELVKDIYGVEENVGLGNTFEANYKELQRLDKVIRQNSNYSSVKGILAENKERYVNFVKDIISNSELKKSVEDFNKGKKISHEELQKVIEVYLKHNDELYSRVERYNYMHKQVEIIQGKSVGILKGIIEYFTEEELLVVEDMIFNDTLKKIENLTSEYKRQIEMICNDVIKTCQYYDKIEDQIYTSKLMKTLIPSIESKKFIDQYNKEIKNVITQNKNKCQDKNRYYCCPGFLFFTCVSIYIQAKYNINLSKRSELKHGNQTQKKVRGRNNSKRT